MEAFVKALSDLHNKCNGNVVREPSHVLLPEEEYPFSIVEFEEMYDLMKVYDKDIQHNKKVYEMIQDVMSCMRDTGMTDSYLRLMFMRGLNLNKTIIVGTLTSNLYNSIFEDDYEIRDGKLFTLEKRVSIIQTFMQKRNPLQLKKDNERYEDMDMMLLMIKDVLERMRDLFDKDNEKEKAAMEKMGKEIPEEIDGDTSGMSEITESDSESESSEEERVNDLVKGRIPGVVM